MIKTFRGQLADGDQERLRLGTTRGKMGYKIVKFQIIPDAVAGTRNSVMSIWKVKQDSIVQGVDFTKANLLGVAAWYNGTYEVDDVVVFDNEIFNQDIYIGLHDSEGDTVCNYYLELEVIPLSDMAAEYTTIKDLRSNA